MGDKITYNADEYSSTKEKHPFRTDVEKYTIFTLIGDLRGKKVLDAGCGDGVYSREMVARGAAHVIGVDAAQDFIDLANEKNIGLEGRIDYHQSFIQDFIGRKDRDLVVGSYILSYPRSSMEVEEYCKAVASHLKSGGVFVGFNNSPFEVFDGVRYKEYGFEKEMHGDQEGGEIVYRVEGMQNPIVNFYLKPSTYQRAFREAGFSRFEWMKVLLDPSQEKNPYWDNFFKNEPPFVAMIAVK